MKRAGSRLRWTCSLASAAPIRSCATALRSKRCRNGCATSNSPPQRPARSWNDSLAQLAPDHPDPAGVQRPFAALVLAEVVRFDRIEPFMTDKQLQQLVDASTRYLQSIRDYRGFDEREGWRHGVAHTSDVMLQLAVNPRTSKAQLDQMLAAIATQVAPGGRALLHLRRRRSSRAGGVLHREAQAAHSR